jgi:spore coat protein A, manganese oxidase
LKDTVQVDPGEVVRIVTYFDHVGMYPIHCHILEHEENEMMRPCEVLPNP